MTRHAMTARTIFVRALVLVIGAYALAPPVLEIERGRGLAALGAVAIACAVAGSWTVTAQHLAARHLRPARVAAYRSGSRRSAR
jgi:hypothetical protein